MNTKYKFHRMFANILSIVVMLAMAFPVTGVVQAANNETVGVRISVYFGDSITFPENTPFHISHGWMQTSDDDAIGIFDFVLEVDGVFIKENFKDFWAETGDPDTLQRRWVYNFPNGMTGTHEFTGRWFAPCQYAVDQLEYEGPCPNPNAKVEAYTTTRTITFTLPSFVAYVPGAIEGYDWPLGNMVTINVNDGEYTAQALSEQRPEDPQGMSRVLFELWRENFSIEAGDQILMTDGTFTKEVVVTNLAVTDINPNVLTVSGTYDPDYDLWVWLYGQEWQIPETNPDNGTWVMTFAELPQGVWGGAVQHDLDGDGTSIDFQVPQLVLYIHYEYPDVVEGSYELGHTVQVTIFDNNGGTKATATVETMEMPHWGGAPGFRVEQWDGMEGPPDIQPGDVVRAVLDDGFLTAEARVGEITGTIDLDTNSITGTINAPWAGGLVNVLCMPWGAPEGASDRETTVTPDSIGEFTCSWDSEWDIQPGETIGVAYWGNDLHWVANAISNPWIVAFPEANQVFGYGWPVGSDVNLNINGTDIATVTVGGAPWDPNDIMAFFDFNGVYDLAAGDEVMLSGSGMERIHIVQSLTVTDVNIETDIVSGTADPGATVHNWVHGFGHDVWLTVPEGTNTWDAYLGSPDFHLEPGMCGRAEIRVEGNNSTNVDWCTPPKMGLRVNYGHDWVESFYEAGHDVSIKVTDSEGKVKATAEAVTEPKDYWDGGTGFQTLDSVWFGADGNQLEYPPDIQPYDRVYAQVDNGITTQVQLGDIRGEVRFDLDSITGTIDVPWITDPLPVECLDWGSGHEPPYSNKDGGFHLTDGSDSFSCSWEGEWDVQPWQDIGVGYSTPDGHWVANAFRDERWTAVWTYNPPTGSLQVGEHSYYYDLAYTVPEYVDYPPMDSRTFTVSGDIPLYGGYALLGPWNYMPVQVWNGSACEVVSALNPDQPLRFISGWVNDYSMTYKEALAHFNSITVDLSWDGGPIDSSSFKISELLPFTGRDERIEYICTFTEHP